MIPINDALFTKVDREYCQAVIPSETAPLLNGKYSGAITVTATGMAPGVLAALCPPGCIT